MRVFGWAWIIYFPEIIWSWLGKWAFDHGNGLKLKFSLQTISRSDAQRERERERARAQEEARSCLRHRRRSPDRRFWVRRSYATVRPSRGSPDRTLQSDDRTLQSDDWEEAQIARSSPTIDLAFDLAPLDLATRSRLRAISASTHRSLSMILIFVVVVWWFGSGVWVVVAFDCRNLLPWVELEFRWCVVLAVILKFF